MEQVIMVVDPAPDVGSDTLFLRQWSVPWHSHIVPIALSLVVAVVFLWGGVPVASHWALSWRAIENGRVMPLVLHVFAHGGWLHVLLNLSALLFLSAPLISRLGQPPLAWVRYLYMLIGSGISGGVLFLLVNRDSDASVLGISGAVFGLVAALTRVHPATGSLVSVRSQRTWLLVKFFVQNHLALFLLLAIMAVLSGRWIGLAWEAHLGGLLFGFFATPLYLERSDK
ncbi:rhomboid family intramembrane serine protease [Sphingomonas sp. Ag1]|uniref:rhomboid family intramembrane serine protease n=1 Tax=Sphingomonas sp. Ag1 TaxID=1642949 RepID=UPI0009E1FFA2|nr:rhomboid family intramembrane serine protease [Sphingomonas sp. Ag1]